MYLLMTNTNLSELKNANIAFAPCFDALIKLKYLHDVDVHFHFAKIQFA